jgi:hypothetical protein
MLFMYRLSKTASLHLFVCSFFWCVKRILGVTMINDFRGARLRHYCADGACCECWNHTKANSNCSISRSNWLIALDTKFWCKLDALWRETNPTLSFIWLLCVCVQEFPTIQNFLNITVYPWDASYIYLLAPFTLSITCNTLLPAETTIILCGRVLMIFLLSYFEHCQIWLKVFLQSPLEQTHKIGGPKKHCFEYGLQ